jgi:DNA-binding transcriptional regulator LsrR (DeoR family)
MTIARRSRHELGLSGAEIARHLGVNTSSINRALAREEDGVRQEGIRLCEFIKIRRPCP